MFDAGEFFLAHETLEEHWIEAPAKDRDFLQGLIHLATGFHHHVRGNNVGARLQFNKALNRLSGYPDEYAEVDIAHIRNRLEACLEAMESGSEMTAPNLSKPDTG